MEFQDEEIIGREKRIAAYLMRGLHVGQIAIELSVSKKIIKAHVSKMMQKLNAKLLGKK
jgi:DNA-binding NarL/FixJ family response regulator